MRYKWVALVFTFLIIVAAALELVPALLYKEFFDAVSREQFSQRAELVEILVLLVGVYLVNWVIWRIAEVINNIYKNKIMVDLSSTAFSYLHGHSVSFFHNNFVGSLVKKVKRFVDGYNRIFGILTWDLLPILVTIVVIFSVLVQRSPMFGVAVLVYAVAMIGFNYAFSQFKLKYDKQRTQAHTKWTGHLADTITNYMNVQFFNGHKREVKDYDKIQDKVRRLNTFTWQLGDLNEGVQVLIIIGLEFALFWGAIGLWQQGLLSVGDFVLIQAYVIQLAHKFWGIGRIMRDYYESMSEANEMTEILLMPHAIADSKSAVPLANVSGGIVFDDVSFYYNKTRKIITKFDLAITAKQSIAFVGPSGAGKSTLVKLILRMHDVSKGKILIDGQKVSAVTLESLRAAISYVPQTPILFHRTLMENIRYGKPDATDEEVYRAAKLAHCDEFIQGFPQKYETYVGERGVKLSGGERQRVAIARAILRNAPILILDEATSSLDSESEHLIQDALDHLMKDKTVIVIAHRLSTIMKMDRIVVIENGTIVEQGTHKQLIRKRKGTYKKLWEFQVGGFIRK